MWTGVQVPERQSFLTVEIYARFDDEESCCRIEHKTTPGRSYLRRGKGNIVEQRYSRNIFSSATIRYGNIYVWDQFRVACTKGAHKYTQIQVVTDKQSGQFLRYTDGVAMAKKKELGSLTIQASKTAIVIAFTADSHQQGNSNKAVGIIAEYLESMNM